MIELKNTSDNVVMGPRVEDSPAASHLVVFEDRAEMDCVIKYLLDEFADQTDTR